MDLKIDRNNRFARIRKLVMVTLCMFFLTISGCSNQNDSWPTNYDKINWSVRLKLKPQLDKKYLANEDPEIKALISKHDLMFYQTYPETKSVPELLLYYTLKGKNNKENAIKDFLETGKFENDVYEYEETHPNK